jgi:hypothetical protein
MPAVTWTTRDTTSTLATRAIPRVFGGTLILSSLTLTTRAVPRIFGGTLTMQSLTPSGFTHYLNVTWTTRDEKAPQSTRDDLVTTWITRG